MSLMSKGSLVQTIEMSGYKLEGPYKIEGDNRLPTSSGIYMVLTKTDDSRLRGIYIAEAGNVKKHVFENPNVECWKKNQLNGISIWIHSTVGESKEEREAALFELREDRHYKMPCRD